MNSNVSIRDYGIDDLVSMFLLDEECFSSEFRFGLNSMRGFAEETRAIVRIAVGNDGSMAGFVVVHLEEMIVGTTGYVVTLDVADGWRRKGVAALLMQDAENKAVEGDAAVMQLHVFIGNRAAIRFYERIGYLRAGTQRGFYGRDGLDAFVYRKTLIAGDASL